MTAVLMLMLAAAVAVAWPDCPAPCRCRWMSGKKTALCQDAGFSAIPDTFDNDIQVLDLSNNYIAKLDKGGFKTAGLLNLQRVFISNASLEELHKDAFKDLFILVHVNLSRNRISTLHPDTFRGNERLRVLYLSGNPLRKLVQAQFPPLPHLQILELDECELRSVDKNAFAHLIALERLSLKNNFLRSLSEASFTNLAHLRTIELDGNPWRCDCALRGFRDWFFLSKLNSVSLLCSAPKRLENKRWEHVPSEEFACAPKVSVSQQAVAGGHVSFGCHVSGDPEPQVSWLYEGYPINHTRIVIEVEEGVLEKWANISVYNTSYADTGVYTCVASNVLDVVALNVTLVLPEVVTEITIRKSKTGLE